MKLYVKKQVGIHSTSLIITWSLQIIDRVLIVHGSLENLEIKKESKKEAKERRAETAFDAKVKEMRQHVSYSYPTLYRIPSVLDNYRNLSDAWCSGSKSEGNRSARP